MDDLFRMDLNQYLPLRDVVFNSLREAILSGALKPGERLMEKQLADKMGVSRTPIREAIRKLELEGLVDMVPRKGAEVARVTEKDIKDVLEIRAALEELAIKLVCDRIVPSDLNDLKNAKESFDASVALNDVDGIIKNDVLFHDAIFKASKNDKLINLVNNLREQINRYRVEYIKSMSDYSVIAEEHSQILQFIIAKNSEGAKATALKHIENQEKAVIEYFNSHINL